MQKGTIIIIGITIVTIGVIIAGALLMENKGRIMFGQTNIPCLVAGHQNLAQHIHPELSIMVDGIAEQVPGNLGVTPTCMSEVHTHEENGMIHIETLYPNVTYTLQDFFTVWGRSIEREGFTLRATVDGEALETPSELTLVDHQKIVFTYTKE